MIPATTTPFAQRYQVALRSHLISRSRNRTTSPAARALGREALAAEVNLLDLVRIHDHSLAILNIPVQAVLRNGLTPSGTFLIEALGVINKANQRTHKNICAALLLREKQFAREVDRYNELLTQSHHLQEQSKSLAHQLLITQEEERREISRELHDEVAQILAGINVRLAALQDMGELSNLNLQHSILQTQKMIETSVNVVHRYARKLRPAMLDDLGLIPALQSFIKELPRTKDLKIRFTAFPEIESMDNIRRTVFYRVGQEALLNIIRHAQALRVTVKLRKIPQGARLEVHDNGKSFDVEPILASIDAQHLGLLGMKERVEMVGGRFSITSSPAKGTTVRADIPFATSTQNDR